MDDIINKASELGSAILESELFVKYRRVSSQLAASPAPLEKVKKFMKLSAVMREKQKYADEITESEKNEMSRLAQDIFDDPVSAEYIELQNEFGMFMQEIFSRIEGENA